MFLSRASYYKRGLDWSKRDGAVIEALNIVVGQHTAGGGFGSVTGGLGLMDSSGIINVCIWCIVLWD